MEKPEHEYLEHDARLVKGNLWNYIYVITNRVIQQPVRQNSPLF